MTPLAAEWDAAYTSGTFDGFQDVNQQARYRVIGEAVFQCATVLDIGCGIGHLRPFIDADYTGIDISSVAIEEAKERFPGNERQWPNTEFICADAETWTPDRKLDAVVLNEFLYYTNDPLKTLRKWAGYVKLGGLLVVSIQHRHDLNLRWWLANFNLRGTNPNTYSISVTKRFAGKNLKQEIPVSQNGKQWTVLVIHF